MSTRKIRQSYNYSQWYKVAADIIRPVLTTLPETFTREQIKAALRPHYPFGPREHHPYKMWLKAVNDHIDARLGRSERKAEDNTPRMVLRNSPYSDQQPWLAVYCGWCYSRWYGCMMCGRLISRLNSILADPEFRTLQAGALDMAGWYVLRDYLAEHHDIDASIEGAPRKRKDAHDH